LNWVDIVIVASIIWFTYAAFNAGMIREVVTIIGAVFAVVLAGLFYEDLAKNLDSIIDNEETAKVVAFGLLFAGVVLASQLTAMFLKQAASLLMLGIFDSMGGAIIGFIKGFIFVEIALILAITFESLDLQEAVEDSAFATIFLDALPVLKHLLPGEFKTAIDNF
jgi:uncharacterized membrane protein required for colicin V production